MNGKILVIDDLTYDVKALKMILEHSGYTVISASTGAEGMEKAISENPDGILLDIQLPDTDGFEICRCLKEDVRTAVIPIVFLTAHYQDEASLIRGLNIGANDYICKPFNSAELLARVGVMVRIRRAEENLLKLSLTDELTGMGNRRFLLTRLEEEYERSRRNGSLFACLMLDIDYFKRFNDAYGHQVGDRVLKELAALLREQTRKCDVLGRYGGEEFLLVLAVKWPSESIWVAERIRLAVEKLLFIKNGNSDEALRVTVSLGVSRCLPSEPGAPDCQSMVRQADRALYEAKRLGRNRVCHWDPDTESAIQVEQVEKTSG